MKKIYFLLGQLLIWTVLMVSCQKEDPTSPSETEAPKSLQCQMGEGTPEIFTWQRKDCISVSFPESGIHSYQIEDAGEGKLSARFDLIPDGQTRSPQQAPEYFVALYPENGMNIETDDENGFVLYDVLIPARQVYDASVPISPNAGVKMAVSTDGSDPWVFQNLCAVLEVPVIGIHTISSAQVKGMNQEALGGMACITYHKEKGAGMSVYENPTYEIELECGEEGAPLNPDAPTFLRFVLPPTVLENGIEIQLFDNEGTQMTLYTNENHKLESSQVLTMEQISYWPDNSARPTLSVSQDKVRTTSVGGTCRLAYTIENPSEGMTVDVRTDADWLTDIRTDDQAVYFKVAKNTSSSDREAQLRVSYSGVSSVTVQIDQDQCIPFENKSFVETVNGASFTMIPVEAGTFTMGATPEQGTFENLDLDNTAHEVTLTENYYIAETELTQEVWKAVMGDNPSYMTGDQCPVNEVSYNRIVNEFLPKLNELTGRTYILPSEAQWEFAARGGNKSQGYRYSGSDNLDEVGWYYDNLIDSGWITIQEVAGKKANELGIYDMSGNAFEWCSDWGEPFTTDAQTDPMGPDSGEDKVYRGGGIVTQEEPCRVGYRFAYYTDFSHYYVSFRLLCY